MFVKPTENFLQAFEKKVLARKMKLQTGTEYCDKTSFFELKLFFKGL